MPPKKNPKQKKVEKGTGKKVEGKKKEKGKKADDGDITDKKKTSIKATP